MMMMSGSGVLDGETKRSECAESKDYFLGGLDDRGRWRPRGIKRARGYKEKPVGTHAHSRTTGNR